MDFNDGFTLANTALCCVLILLRLFYYRKNPELDTLIHRLDVFVNNYLEARYPRPTRERPAPCVEAIGEFDGCNNNDTKSNI